MHSGQQPTKEQVRAYMLQRCQAHLPPPAPDEIRRQLGWCWQCDNESYGSAFPSSQFILVLPGCIAQLSALMAVEWLFLAAGFSASN
jgi:hypothetical protein